MRLICPNCDAQYEVPENVMPPEGRDVQCSNCGTTWFQDHPDHPSEIEAGETEPAQEDEEVRHVDTPAAERRNPFDDPVDVEADDVESDDDQDEVVVEAAPKPPETEDKPVRRELDPAVADVLRAEAELEEQARRNEMSSMESQPDLGLDETPADAKKRAREARDRMARMRGEEAPKDTQTSDLPANEGLGSRRDLLPDIEEINSTLRSNSDRSPASDPGQTAQIEVQEKRSSRRGFTLTVLLVALLALVYTFAPELSEAIPQAAGFLDGYVAMVDSWRAWLDARVVALLSWLDAAAVSSNG